MEIIKDPESRNIEIASKNFTDAVNISKDIIEFNRQFADLLKSFSKKMELLYTKNEKGFSSTSTVFQPSSKSSSNCLNNIFKFLLNQYKTIISTEISSFNQLSIALQMNLEKTIVIIDEKERQIMKGLQQYQESKQDLLSKYKELELNKANYFSEASIGEDCLVKHFNNKNTNKSIKSNSNTYLNTNMSPLYTNEILEKLEVVIFHEKKYCNSVKQANRFENYYLTMSKSILNSIIVLNAELVTESKDIVVDSIVYFQNTFQMILIEIGTYLPSLYAYQVGEEYSKQITSQLIQANNLYKTERQPYKIKILNYYLKKCDINNKLRKLSTSSENEINGTFHSFNSINEDITLYKSLSYEDMHEIITIIKTKGYKVDISGYDFEIEENKGKIKKIIMKFLDIKQDRQKSNSKNNGFNWEIINSIVKDDTNCVMEEEGIFIEKCIDKSVYRGIFLQKLNELRINGSFNISKFQYDKLGKLLNKILDIVTRDSDYFSAKSVIILSQTFYYVDKKVNNKKIFLQEAIQGHELGQEKDFWEKFLIFSITHEINESLDGTVKDEMSKDKGCENIVFGQLVPITDNMIGFGMNEHVIKEIIDPIMTNFKIKTENKSIIYEMFKISKI